MIGILNSPNRTWSTPESLMESRLVGSSDQVNALNAKLMQLCRIQLILTILLSRLALTFGDKQIQLAWVAGFVCFVLIAWQTKCQLSNKRLAAIVAIFLIIIVETTCFHSDYSPLSLAYLFAIYTPLCLSMPSLTEGHLKVLWTTFIDITTLLAVCALLQVGLQVILPSYFLDPLSLLPDQFQLTGYMTAFRTSLGPISYFKPNGIFALEPSFLSQFVALGLLGEMHYNRRKLRIALMLAAMVASLSGTGFLILLGALPFNSKSPKWIFLLIFIGIVINFAVGDQIDSFYARRLDEFSTPGQSGNARFVLPYQVLGHYWTNSRDDLLFGIGAGQSTNLNTVFEANFAPFAKVGIEFGLLGVIVFVAFWLGMFANLTLPLSLMAALFIFYFIACGALLHPPTVFPLWTLTLGFMSHKTVFFRSRTAV